MRLSWPATGQPNVARAAAIVADLQATADDHESRLNTFTIQMPVPPVAQGVGVSTPVFVPEFPVTLISCEYLLWNSGGGE